MTDLISHRGPDGFGIWEEGQICLGHRRLAIVDLSEAGKQPMEYMDRYVITYNGEVYNHIEIRLELEKNGYSFTSHSDTEVILAAFDIWGPRCLDKFNGMWGLIIYDRESNKIFCARDRFGVKPLYYWVSPTGTIAFASEIKQFTCLPGWSPTLNKNRVNDFLIWGIHDHTEETMFQGVYQVAPGSMIFENLNDLVRNSIPDNQLKTNTWYTLPQNRFTGSFKDATIKFKNFFTDAIALRLRADVNVGSCLSGGVDSSSIVCTANKILSRDGVPPKNQKTFSAYSAHKQFDESKYVSIVTNSLDVSSYSTTPEFKELRDKFELITWHQDEPFGSSSIFAQWKVFELAKKENCIVMLDGQGADEQLAGYQGFIGARLAELFVSGNLIQLLKELRAHRALQGYSLKSLFTLMVSSLITGHLKTFLKLKSHKPTQFKNWLKIEDPKSLKHPYETFKTNTRSVNEVCRAQLCGLNLQMLLRYEDRDSMAHSIESRVPFLDYRLVEFVASIPSEFKISDGLTKRILRESMTGVLPKEIQWRMDKLAFATAEEVWMKSEAPEFFRQELKSTIDVSNGLISPNIMTELEEMIAGQRPFDVYIWRIISLGKWIKVFNVNV